MDFLLTIEPDSLGDSDVSELRPGTSFIDFRLGPLK